MSSQGLDDQPNGVHFFKVILENNLQEGKLRVPKSFVRKHWKGLTNPVLLRLPNKTQKKVSWTKSDDDIWFCNGWKEFANYLSLKASQFVVFRYEKNSCFNLIVFRESGLEIKYPPRETAEEYEEADDESECSLKVLEDFSSSPNIKRRKSLSPSSQTFKKMKTNSNEQNKFYRRSGSNKDLKERIRVFHEKVKKDFHSEKDFFTFAIQKTYTEKDLMPIPNEFSNPHLHKMEGKIATLFYQHRTWDVKLKRNSLGNMTFTNGWRKFLNDNNLKIGDVCAFVLNQSKGLSFEVLIFPMEKDSSTPLHRDLKERIRVFHENVKKDFHSKKDFFTCAMQKTYTEKDLMRIPNEFSNPHLHKMEGKIATLFDQHRTWDVKLKRNSLGNMTFTNGWRKFLNDNNLKIGDVCAFVLNQSKGLSFKVLIFPMEKDSSTPLHRDQEELFHRPSSSIRTPESLKSESRMISEKEFIHYIRRTSNNMASIPINYIRNFVSETGKTATLRVGERSWPVKVLFYDINSCAWFSNGWTEFAGACNLKVGDSCHFKIVDKEKLVFEVTISRRSR